VNCHRAKQAKGSMPHNAIKFAIVLQQLPTWLAAAVLTIAAAGSCNGTARAEQGYQFRGVQAPRVKPLPLVNQLTQKLSELQELFRRRSIRAPLSSALEQSLLNNPELAQAYAQIQQSQWNLIAVRRQWYPTISATAAGPAGGIWGYQGSRSVDSLTSNGNSSTETRTENRTAFAPALSLGWTFFDPSRGPDINAASENLRSQELLFNVSARNLVLQTQLAYFTLQEQLQLIKSYEQILQATTQQVKQTEALFNSGNSSIADVEQIKTQQFQTLSLVISSYLGVIEGSASLAKAMALQPGQLVLPEDNLDQYGQWDVTLNTTIQQAQDLREEIQSSLAQASSAKWRASALFNRYWPRFALAANGTYVDLYSRSGLNGSSNLNFLQSSSWSGGVGIGFNWAIFDGGIAAAQAMANKAAARELSDQAAVQRLQVSEEVEQSYASYETSRLSLLSSREQAVSARKAAEAVRERFNVGYADTTSVVQTLNQAISAANAYARSQREYNSAVARLYRSSAQWPDKTQSLRDRRVLELQRR